MVIKMMVNTTFDFTESLSKMKRLPVVISVMRCPPTKVEELNNGSES